MFMIEVTIWNVMERKCMNLNPKQRVHQENPYYTVKITNNCFGIDVHVV